MQGFLTILNPNLALALTKLNISKHHNENGSGNDKRYKYGEKEVGQYRRLNPESVPHSVTSKAVPMITK